jgi:ethanolamine ammonia-lyase large subunit
MGFAHSVGGTRHVFADLRTLLARATPARSGDALAGVAAGSARSGWRRSAPLPTCR